MTVTIFKWMVQASARYPRGMFLAIQLLCMLVFMAAGYRKRIIRQNLKNAFPGKKPAEIRQIHHQYIRVIMRYISEAFQVFGNTKKDMARTCYVQQNPDWEDCFTHSGSAIVMASHFGNWETNVVLLPEFTTKKVVGFYKPLRHKGLDKILKSYRSRYGLLLIPIDQTVRYMSQHKNEDTVYIFLADQGPFNLNGAYWNRFLHQMTPWYTGAEKLARRWHLPVFYLAQIPMVSQESFQSGPWYRLEIKTICTKPEILEEGVITEKYTRILEHEIQTLPAYWLWSHRRWKRAHAAPAD